MGHAINIALIHVVINVRGPAAIVVQTFAPALVLINVTIPVRVDAHTNVVAVALGPAVAPVQIVQTIHQAKRAVALRHVVIAAEVVKIHVREVVKVAVLLVVRVRVKPHVLAVVMPHVRAPVKPAVIIPAIWGVRLVRGHVLAPVQQAVITPVWD